MVVMVVSRAVRAKVPPAPKALVDLQVHLAWRQEPDLNTMALPCWYSISTHCTQFDLKRISQGLRCKQPYTPTPSPLQLESSCRTGDGDFCVALVTQQPINGLHLAQTQIAFFHCQCATHRSQRLPEELSAWKGVLGCVNSIDHQQKHVLEYSCDERY